jgi:hypothetical protein
MNDDEEEDIKYINVDALIPFCYGNVDVFHIWGSVLFP